MAPDVPAGTARWLARGEQDLPSGGARLTADEATRASGMSLRKRRTEYLLRRWVCKATVAPFVGLPDDPRSLARIEVTNRASGAPVVVVDRVDAGLGVSLSDGADRAVYLVGDAVGSVGCDLELVEPRSPAFVADFLTPAEQEYAAAQPALERDVASNLIWSAKERPECAAHRSTPGHPRRRGRGRRSGGHSRLGTTTASPAPIGSP